MNRAWVGVVAGAAAGLFVVVLIQRLGFDPFVVLGIWLLVFGVAAYVVPAYYPAYGHWLENNWTPNSTPETKMRVRFVLSAVQVTAGLLFLGTWAFTKL